MPEDNLHDDGATAGGSTLGAIAPVVVPALAATALAGLGTLFIRSESKSGVVGQFKEICVRLGVLRKSWFNDAEIREGREAFKQCLNNGKHSAIRVFVDSADGRGHQASSVNLLRRLAAPADQHGYAYKGTIEIAYDEEYKEKTLPKLEALFPEVDFKKPPLKLNDATLELKPFRDGKTDDWPPVEFGFSGAADEDENLAKKLRTRKFLRLQPYRWEKRNEIQFEPTELKSIRMDDDAVEAHEKLAELPYRLPARPPPRWEDYEKGGDLAKKAAILRRLIEENQKETLGLAPLYGIQSGKTMLRPPQDVLFNVTVGTLGALQSENTSRLPRHAVLVNTGDLQRKDLTQVDRLIHGDESETERIHRLSNHRTVDYESHQQRRTDLNALEAEQRIKLVTLEPAPSGDRPSNETRPEIGEVDLQKDLDWLASQDSGVLVVQLGPLPPELFQHLFEQASLPSVFEGQNTANQAIYLGKPYLHASMNQMVYPSLSANDDEMRNRAKNAAQQVRTVLAPDIQEPPWKAISTFIQDPDGKSEAYFTRLGEHYRSRENDKLDVALAILGREADCCTPPPNK
ncbi:hypothetical protein [Chondromyces crocatus]|uniref:Uncharacterized protein n=1 Tax=Chondromyces crocatus TaxID=52 RepID=A0A0K1EB23_CHOCO|nr:hypothetical protein [Chondromyces crocatus]AKT37892.1 uncharacterized protein CMC5_020350 [Chondromyces crocatus]